MFKEAVIYYYINICVKYIEHLGLALPIASTNYSMLLRLQAKIYMEKLRTILHLLHAQRINQ